MSYYSDKKAAAAAAAAKDGDSDGSKWAPLVGGMLGGIFGGPWGAAGGGMLGYAVEDMFKDDAPQYAAPKRAMARKLLQFQPRQLPQAQQRVAQAYPLPPSTQMRTSSFGKRRDAAMQLAGRRG